MSYILDALKKIEQEKNKKARPDGRVNISGELFQEWKQPASRLRLWKSTALIVLASLVTCTGTWYMLQGSASKSAVPIRSIPAPPTAPVNPPSAVQNIPETAQAIPVPAAPPAAQPVMPIMPESSAEDGDDSSARGSRRTKKQKMVQTHTPNQPAQAAQAPADIKLSGIAWQDERSARRAVVNGFLLKEGSVVSGAKIIDIQADRVRFLSSGGQFELKLDAVLPAGVQK